MANLKRRIERLEQNLGTEPITLRFVDGRTEMIRGKSDYEGTLLRLLVESTDGNPPPWATPSQEKHFHSLCECESYKERGGGHILELGLAIMRSPGYPITKSPPPISLFQRLPNCNW